MNIEYKESTFSANWQFDKSFKYSVLYIYMSLFRFLMYPCLYDLAQMSYVKQ